MSASAAMPSRAVFHRLPGYVKLCWTWLNSSDGKTGSPVPVAIADSLFQVDYPSFMQVYILQVSCSTGSKP